MTYEQLTSNMQNIVSYNHDYIMKILFLLLFFGVSAIYLFYYKSKVEKKTVFWSVMIMRIITTGFSFFGLVFSPYLLLTLDPAYSFAEFFEIYGIIYGSFLVILMFIVLMDFYRFIITWFLRMVGFNTNSQQYYKFKKWMRTYIKHE